MEVEVSQLVGAELGERTEDRATHRNGYRPRRWDTRAGEIELQPRKRSEQALVSVDPGLEIGSFRLVGRSSNPEPSR